ncbi:alpha/beta-type small acid-soluble spore protein [Halobacillus sp. ACCC02827]|uniref:alpha/beta-type small acid-soluble spore protein n=1 Tax=Bacillaceae TaxID=186817 RepID=UPI0004057E38|nr:MULTISPECIES: alpha/beta-type small acid-soluble spore protein [Bacillaceae]QHT47568.1 alpha/beta-type small acid-soluble spore protein [Bacillus sp. SB49]WJE14797.1 alpha/beta-type small acid-soluble spore protein [Halobacillus sp. ACCC02827]
MPNRKRILVPEARAGLDQLKKEVTRSSTADRAKFEVAEELGIPLREKGNGDLSTKDAGRIGGRIGGGMVKEMIRRAQMELQHKNTEE